MTRSNWSVRRAIAWAGLAFIGLASACAPVAFYEKEKLASPLMSFAESGTHTNFMQKVYYSREASVGGIGSNAGGGCGCTN